MRQQTSRSVNIAGINIQWPWSELLLTKVKVIETRGYPLPEKYLNTWLALIETRNPKREKALIIGAIKFESCFQYSSYVQWANDFPKHLVKSDDKIFSYKRNDCKWGWVVSSVKTFTNEVPPPKTRGIVYAKECPIPLVEGKSLANVF